MSRTRVLKTKLRERLSEAEQEQVSFTAKSIGIAPNTLRTLLRDDWDQLARSSIERVCDRFGLEVQDLFELAPDDFWAPFEKAGRYTIIRGTRKGEFRDQLAIAILGQSLHTLLPSVGVRMKSFLEEEEKIVDYVQNNNCVVVGSPRTNPATEVVLCRHFGAQPFVPSAENRAKVPVRFVFPKDDRIVKSYTTVEAWSGLRGKGSGLGVCDGTGRELIVEVDWWPKEEYFSRTVLRGRDCGLLCVIKRPFGTIRDVKTIILAGFSTPGTEGVARALVRNFRDLEPVHSARHVLGVVEAIYNKTIPNIDNRGLVGVQWKFLTGGRKRIRRQ